MPCCPVCRSPLIKQDRSYCCRNNHSFDLASSGYLNLLLPNKRHSANPGDSKEMVLARRDFLAGGYYDFLKDRICQLIETHLAHKTGSVLVDIGCGEGYYTKDFSLAAKAADPQCSCYGIDLAKDGLKVAAKRDTQTLYCVASLGDMPFLDESVDLLINVFVPYSDEEFARVLRPGGILITAVPAQEHLFGLKEFLYEKPYKNKLAPYDLPHFKLHSQETIDREALVTPGKDIRNLFQMTPYYWKTSLEATQRLAQLEELSTPFHFGIITYEKK